MTHGFTRSARLVILALSLTGCARVVRSPERQAAERAAMDWRMTLAQVDVEAAAGRYPIVDRLLVDFQQSHPGSPELAWSSLRRALYMLDPSNQSASPADARAVLDSLLAGAIEPTQRAEASALKRIAAALEARPVVVRAGGQPGAAGSSPAGAAPATGDAKAKDDEIARLKDEVARANAELERVRRRIATPKP